VNKWNVVYCRVSSQEQRENQTIAGQRSEVLRYCQARGIQIDKVYDADDGVSGTIRLDQRPGGSQLLADAAAGRIERIIGWKIDRLGRGLRDYLNLKNRLARLGVSVTFTSQELPEGRQGLMMEQFLAMIAEQESLNIKENTCRGLEAKARAGGWTGGSVPLGYRVAGAKHEARLVLHELYAKVVRRLFELCADGKSCTDLVDYLNTEGIPTARQNTSSIWRPGSVHQILTNTIYTGTRQFRRRRWYREENDAGDIIRRIERTPQRVIEYAVPQIVDQDLFDRANQQLKARRNETLAHAKNQYLLRQKITCSVCGLKYTGSVKYYRCAGRHYARTLKPRKPCTGLYLNRSEVEERIWNYIAGFIAFPGDILEELER
jgi:site-specific DNA recombinase